MAGDTSAYKLISVILYGMLSATHALGTERTLVISVLDGDTIEVLHNQHPERIRLSGIDCPEKGQPFGQRAKQATSELIFGKAVALQTHNKDKYGRTIADVLLPDGTIVNHELVKDGWCWWYRKYAPNDVELERLETAAREAKKGLWQDPSPVPPWIYRKTRRGRLLDLSDMVSLHTPPASERSSPEPLSAGVHEQDSSPSPYPIAANRKSDIYHQADCPNFSQVSSHSRILFNSQAEAKEAGYQLSRNCP